MAYRTISITTDQPAQEGIASGTIYPGMALERTSTADTVQPHSVADGAVNARLVAVEDEWQGRGIATAYTADNRCFFKSFQPGDEAYMRIASGQNIALQWRHGQDGVRRGAGSRELPRRCRSLPGPGGVTGKFFSTSNRR